MRRITRTIQHLLTGSRASQKLARANAARARLTLEAWREEREGFDSYLEAHRAALASLDHEIELPRDHGGD